MKYFRAYQSIFPGLLFLLLLALLPGYTAKEKSGQFPIPLSNPALALYHNFSISGVYDFDNSSDQALSSLSAEILQMLPEKSSWQTQDSVASLLKRRIITGCLSPQELYFYFRDSESFALVIEGNFLPGEISKFLPGSDYDYEKGFLLKKLPFNNSKLNLEISKERILLYPEKAGDEIRTGLENTDAQLDPKFSAFASMLKTKPAIASEIDFEHIKKVAASSTFKIPHELLQLQHLRLIADAQLTKLQLFMPESDARTSLTETIDLKTAAMIIPGNPELSLNEKGKSIFIETNADQNLERLISQKFAALLLHFLVKNSDKAEFVAVNPVQSGDQIE